MDRREATGTVPVASALRTRPGATRGPPEATQATSAPAISSSGDASRGPTGWTRSRSRRAMRTSSPPAEPDRRLPSESQRQAPQRPEEEPQRAALLLQGRTRSARAARDPPPRSASTSPSPRPPALHSAVGPRRDQLVGAGKEALHQVRGGAAARRARVEPAEEDLHQGSRHLGGEDALGRLVKAADVERAGVAKRDRGRAGRERVVHVDDVELDPAEQLLERAAEVDGHRRRARGRAARHRQARAHRQHRRPAIAAGPLPLPGAVEQRRRPLAGSPDHTARLANSRP